MPFTFARLVGVGHLVPALLGRKVRSEGRFSTSRRCVDSTSKCLGTLTPFREAELYVVEGPSTVNQNQVETTFNTVFHHENKPDFLLSPLTGTGGILASKRYQRYKAGFGGLARGGWTTVMPQGRVGAK